MGHHAHSQPVLVASWHEEGSSIRCQLGIFLLHGAKISTFTPWRAADQSANRATCYGRASKGEHGLVAAVECFAQANTDPTPGLHLTSSTAPSNVAGWVRAAVRPQIPTIILAWRTPNTACRLHAAAACAGWPYSKDPCSSNQY